MTASRASALTSPSLGYSALCRHDRPELLFPCQRECRHARGTCVAMAAVMRYAMLATCT